jgi:hypothetical protein
VHDALDAASGHEVPGQRVDRAGLVQAEATYALARVVEMYGRLLMNRIDRIDSVLTEIKSQIPSRPTGVPGWPLTPPSSDPAT